MNRACQVSWLIKPAKSLQEPWNALKHGDVRTNRRLSAKLNGLYSIYEDDLAGGNGDMHYLIATDTALGRKAAEVIRVFLQQSGLSVDVYVPDGLSTADPSDFSNERIDQVVRREHLWVS